MIYNHVIHKKECEEKKPMTQFAVVTNQTVYRISAAPPLPISDI